MLIDTSYWIVKTFNSAENKLSALVDLQEVHKNIRIFLSQENTVEVQPGRSTMLERLLGENG